MRKILKSSETDQLRERVGPELYARLQASRHLCAAAGDAYVLSLRYCDIREPASRDERITLYCSASELIFAGDDRRCLDALRQAGENEPPPRQLLQFFLALTADDALQRRFASPDRRADHLLESVLHLREVITHVREAYQAQIDIEQNQIMKVRVMI